MNVDNLIPRTGRVVLYVAFAVLVLVHGGIVAAYTSTGVTALPEWVTVSGSALTYLTTAPIVVALFNLTPTQVAAVQNYETTANSDMARSDYAGNAEKLAVAAEPVVQSVEAAVKPTAAGGLVVTPTGTKENGIPVGTLGPVQR